MGHNPFEDTERLERREKVVIKSKEKVVSKDLQGKIMVVCLAALELSPEDHVGARSHAQEILDWLEVPPEGGCSCTASADGEGRSCGQPVVRLGRCQYCLDGHPRRTEWIIS